MRTWFFVLVSIGLLSGCSSSLFMGAQLGAPDFVGQPYVFRAFKIDIAKSKKTPQTDVQERLKFPTTLRDGMGIWARQRVRTTGGDHALELFIKRADVTEEEDIHSSLWSWLGSESTFRYHGTLEIVLKLYRAGSKTAMIVAETKVERTMDIDSDTSTTKRQEAFNKMILSMLYEFDTNMSFIIPQRFAPFLLAY